MRVKIVFGLLLVLFVATAVMMATRDHVAHTAPASPASLGERLGERGGERRIYG